VYDPRVLHCGSENQPSSGEGEASRGVRAMFTVGFRNPKVTGDFGFKGSLRTAYRWVWSVYHKLLRSYSEVTQKLQTISFPPYIHTPFLTPILSPLSYLYNTTILPLIRPCPDSDKITFGDLTSILNGYKPGGKDPFEKMGNGLWDVDVKGKRAFRM
jgi:hypothetical protein